MKNPTNAVSVRANITTPTTALMPLPIKHLSPSVEIVFLKQMDLLLAQALVVPVPCQMMRLPLEMK